MIRYLGRGISQPPDLYNIKTAKTVSIIAKYVRLLIVIIKKQK
jgi:hypothetical protein